jgi:bile acid transporter
MDLMGGINLLFLLMLMLGLGIAVHVERFRENFKKPKGILIGLVCQFVFMPPLAYAVGGMFKLENLHRIALVLLGCCPGGAMSNILCFLFRADIDLSVAMTTASSFGAIVMMPLNIFLYVNLTGLSDDVDLDYVGIVMSALLVVIGLGGGIYIKKWAGENGKKGEKVMGFVAKLGTIGGLGTVISSLIANSQSDTPIYDAPGKIYAASFVQVLVGISLGFGISSSLGLRKPSCVAVSVETSVQNAVLAMAIIALSFDSDDSGEAAVVPMCYMLFSTWTNVVWSLVAWKLFGFTDLPREATFQDAVKAYKESFTVVPAAEGLEDDTSSECHTQCTEL